MNFLAYAMQQKYSTELVGVHGIQIYQISSLRHTKQIRINYRKYIVRRPKNHHD